ncbi:hypothetical protein ACT4WX_10025 [Acinetobacter baumannii]
MSAFKPDDLRRAQLQLNQSLQNGGVRRDQQSRQRADREQRAFAEKEIEYDDWGRKIPKPMFLRPQDIALGEKYDVERVLFTTLGQRNGEVPRRITRDDILAFQENIQLLKDQYSKGITPQNIINLSRQDDIDRANEQIYLAVPVSRKAGLVHLLTNAGPNSKVLNHHVEIEFSNFKSVVFDIDKQALTTVKNRLAKGKIKFQCDCERHTFWYRYMATIGGYNLGRDEGGFPKIRNPHLSGVACKHVLRVVKWISSPAGIAYLKKEVEKDRKKQVGARYKQTDKQIQNSINEQVMDLMNGSVKPIKANIQKAEKEMMRRADKVAKKLLERELKTLKRFESETVRASQIERIQALHKSGAIDQEMLNVFMKGLSRNAK